MSTIIIVDEVPEVVQSVSSKSKTSIKSSTSMEGI